VSANILIIDDDESMRLACLQTLAEAGFRVHAVSSGALALERTKGETFDVVLLDLMMPGIKGMDVLKALKRHDAGVAVVVITGYGTIDTALQAGRFGAYDFLCKPFDAEHLLSLVKKAVSSKRHALEDSCVRMALNTPEASSDVLVGESEAFKRVTRLVKKVAPLDSTVLITGETGSGKELVARMIHLKSRRHQHPFIVVDCGSLVETLFESEMFGHVKGSFTGAIESTKGKFELAHGGTLLLDEIANIDMNLQARLLRVVQEQEVSKVGSPSARKVDVRIISATNRDLSREISEKRFREDLFYRLNVISIHIPPLRERPEDIPVLADYFLRKLSTERRTNASRISEKAMALMKSYPWPGNVRELRNVIERGMVVSENDVLGEEYFIMRRVPPRVDPDSLHNRSLAEVEKREIIRVLKNCRGNRSQAAALLGINRKTLREKMRKYAIIYNESLAMEETLSTIQ